MTAKLALYRIFGIITQYHQNGRHESCFFGPLTIACETGYYIDLRFSWKVETESQVVDIVERNALPSSLKLIQSVLDNKISYTFIKNKFYHQRWPKTNSVTEWDEFYKNMLATIDSFTSLTHFTHFMKLRTFQRLDIIDAVNVSFSDDVNCRLAVRISGHVAVFQHDGVNQFNALHHCQQMLLDHLESTVDSVIREKARRLLEYGVVNI